MRFHPPPTPFLFSCKHYRTHDTRVLISHLFPQLGCLFNIESHILSPEETKELYPLMNVSDVYGTLYVPGDGTMEPAGYCTALARGATRNGAKVTLCCLIPRIILLLQNHVWDMISRDVKYIYHANSAFLFSKILLTSFL